MRNDQVLKIELAIKDNIIKTYTFTQDVVEIGRIPTADIFIDNNGISRRHTRIERSIGGPYIVKDMGSTNGTFLNDIQVNEATLKSNDIISLGKFSLRVILESAEQKKAVSSNMAAEDFDGTTVLSKEQMARLREGLANIGQDASSQKGGRNAGPSGAANQGTGMSVGRMALIAGIVAAAIIIVFLIFK